MVLFGSMKKSASILLLTFIPLSVIAADKPSMSSLWLELIFLIAVIISLKIANFSNQNKLIIFVTYILTGILTKTIWLPVLLWIGLYIYFKTNTPKDTF